MKILLILCAMLFSTGCMSLLDSSDWARVNTKLESLGMDEVERADQIAEWKAREAEQAAALIELEKGIKDMVIDIGGTLAGIPEPVREGAKDWTDDIMKWLILLGGGTAVLGGAEVGRRKIKNSLPGKVFGPVTGHPDPAIEKYQYALAELQKKMMEYEERLSATGTVGPENAL